MIAEFGLAALCLAAALSVLLLALSALACPTWRIRLFQSSTATL
ncbi:hypothetical protein ACFSGX_12205 [Sphingomonas arantia]|uniref:Uncharacterized protein n=1 Tax=Sphingomonas arantia TaxID=1460676 RepID=A0ABW4TXW4_9SPHN